MGVGIALLIVAGVVYWSSFRTPTPETPKPAEPAPQPIAANTSPHAPMTRLAAFAPEETAEASTPAGTPTETPAGSAGRGTEAAPQPPAPPAPRNATPIATSVSMRDVDALISAGRLVEARQKLSAATAGQAPMQMDPIVRRELLELADDTIFSAQAFPEDPLVTIHVINSGEVLQNIGKRYNITAGLLARINNISNPNRIRVGQRIKALNGPLHAVVYKHSFDMFIYLGDTLIHHFKVGLGADGSTPTGVWRVGDKLTNPTYFPPRGGPVVSANDPDNPLGEFWIGLRGIDGEALGQMSYGIHGTNEPNSIGKSMSMGCIRLSNDDIAFLYEMLAPGQSTVTVYE